MEAVKLIPLAISDLNVRYARHMGGNKMRHYIVPSFMTLISKFTGKTPSDIVAEYIMKTENVDDVQFLDLDDTASGMYFSDINEEKSKTSSSGGGVLAVVDVSSIVLGRDRKIGKALMKVKAMSTLYQSNYYQNFFHKLNDRIAYQWNRILPTLNKWLYKLQGADYSVFNPFVYALPGMSFKYIRDVEPVRFLSIGFEGGQAEQAMTAMREDLRTLYKLGLIKGHLAMPSILRLADNIGMGNYNAMFCFVIVNQRKLLKLTGKDVVELPRLPLELVGVKYETFEGDIKWIDGKAPRDSYEIEEIVIRDLAAEEGRQMVLDAYDSSREIVQQASDKVRSNLKNWEKVESRTKDVGYSTDTHRKGSLVEVDVTLRNKETGEEARITSEGTTFSRGKKSW